MVHVTVLKEDEDPLEAFQLQVCSGCEAGCDGKRSRYHCPICPPNRFKPTWINKVKTHLAAHFSHSRGTIHLRGYKITGCLQLCHGYKDPGRGRSHFHCAFCPRMLTKKISFIQHLSACGLNADSIDSVSPTDDLLGMEVSTEWSHSPQDPALEPSSDPKLEPSTELSADIPLPQKFKCPHCSNHFHPKSLRRHIRLKHIRVETNTKDVQREKHLYACCVDSTRGVYSVARNSTNPRYPVHVVRTERPNELLQCDVEDCMELSQIQWCSGNTSYLCHHLQSVPYAVPGICCSLDTDRLECMVSLGFLRTANYADCISRLEWANEELIPLLVKIPNDPMTSDHYTFFSVFTECISWWCKSERTFVTLNTKISAMSCQCQRKGCEHMAIVKWWLFQEGQVSTLHALSEEEEVQPEEVSCNNKYPPVDEPLEKMMAYIQSEKTIPLDILQLEFIASDIPAHFIPPETTCHFCSGTLSEPKIICQQAMVVHNTNQPNTGYETYYKDCLECHTTYRYQEHCHGIFNYNDYLLVTHAALMEIRAGLVNQNAISHTVKSIGYRLDIDLDLKDMENAYLAFEALQSHEYEFFCILCGYHPKILIHDLTRKAVFEYASSLQLPNDPEPEVDVQDFWSSVSKEIIARGIVKDRPNPFKVSPSFENWAPYMGPHTRSSRKMFNTEYCKVIQVDSDEHDPVPEDFIIWLFHEEKVDTIRRFCHALGISQKGSRLDLLCRIRDQSMTMSVFNHAYAALHSHSGGLLTSSCPHNVTYAVKFLLGTESPRDYCDILRSMHHVPTINISDIAHTIARTANREIEPGFFRPFSGRLAEATEIYVEAAKTKQLDVSMPFLMDDCPVLSGPENHPITGTSERYMLFDWFHETNTKEPVESLRCSSFVRELKGIMNTEATKQLYRDKARDIYTLNEMGPSNHIFMFRLLAHLKNELTNKAIIRRTTKHIPMVSFNSLGQLINADSLQTECLSSAVHKVTFRPARRGRTAADSNRAIPSPTGAMSTFAPVTETQSIPTSTAIQFTCTTSMPTQSTCTTQSAHTATQSELTHILDNDLKSKPQVQASSHSSCATIQSTQILGSANQSTSHCESVSQMPELSMFGTDILYMYKIFGDGNSFFRSIGFGMLGYTEDQHAHLRRLTWEWCQKNRASLDITNKEMKELKSLGHPVGNHAAIAIANILSARIVIWYDKSEKECQIFLPYNGKSQHTIHLYFHVHGHYDVMTASPAAVDNSLYHRWLIHQMKLVSLDRECTDNIARKRTEPDQLKKQPVKQQRKTKSGFL